MKCDDVQALLIDGCDPKGADRRAAMEHLAECEDCRDAQYAAGMLRAERASSVPPPSPGAFERAIEAATRGVPREHARGSAWHASEGRAPTARRGGFWTGLALGSGSVAAAAAALAWAAFVVRDAGPLPAPATATTPEVTLALYEARDVSISVDAPSALADAEIRVVLTGAITLDGFDDQRELRWRTNLDAGANQLTLPIVATGAGGGQLLVEVQHGQKRRTFVVDVRGAEA